MASCRSKNDKVQEESSVGKTDKVVEISVEDDKEKIMRDFNNIVKSDNEPFVIVKFIDENITKGR